MRPQLTVMPAGTALWRCHASAFAATAFNDTFKHLRFGGNRFAGTTDDPYPYLYLTQEPTTALAEVFLRSLMFSPPDGVRLVPLVQARRYTLSQVRTTTDLTMVQLMTEEDLAGVFQDSWLLESDAPEYQPRQPEEPPHRYTRFWGSQIRRQAPGAAGLRWQSRRHRPRPAMVLFGDRCGPTPVEPVAGAIHDLATGAGLAEANRLLAPLRTVIVPSGWDGWREEE
jgi:hypothetical protein